MSIPIDQVWAALVFTYELCEAVYHAPKAVQNVKKATKKIRDQVDQIRKNMKDPKSTFFGLQGKM